jgi:multisubunit Na+/H+ antiporter MnhB subunit
MMDMSDLFDAVLCTGLLGLAWGAVASGGLFRSVVLFMAFGLLMSIAWTRLEALDLALAEAIIGSGVTGALLLNACHSAALDREQRRAAREPEPGAGVPRQLLAAGCCAVAIGLVWLFTSLQPNRGTARLLDEALVDHVMANRVTAVLLDFRGYDTLLEMVVLLLAILGARLLTLQGQLAELHPADAPRSALLDPLVAIMIPTTMLMGAYLYWAGSSRPGGAFQAGALLGAVGILLRLGGRLVPLERSGILQRAALILGLLVFTAFAFSGLRRGEPAMTYPAGGGYYVMVFIEGCLTLSIAVTLLMLFFDAPGVRLRRYR